MDETNIHHSHAYHAEQARLNFQHNIGSLLELKSFLNEKTVKAKEAGKDGYYTLIPEAAVLDNWINSIATELMADYTIINRTNRLSNKTPDLKDLLK